MQYCSLGHATKTLDHKLQKRVWYRSLIEIVEPKKATVGLMPSFDTLLYDLHPNLDMEYVHRTDEADLFWRNATP